MAMMKYSYKLIIYPLIICLYLLSLPKLSSSAWCCEAFDCRKTSSDEVISVESPFRVRGYHSASCGCPGFGLYCDKELGLLLELPRAGNFSVEDIDYDNREIELSDPNDCLPQKLLALNLTTTPFQEDGSGGKYKVYDCPDGHSQEYYDKIDCLRDSDHTVVVVAISYGSVFGYRDFDDCILIKKVSVPHGYGSNVYAGFDPPLSSISSIHLTWDESDDCESCVKRWQPSKISWRLVLGIALPILIILISLCYCYRWCMKRRNVSGTASITNNTSAHTTTMSAPTSGLDQVTIDSYPVVILGDSGSKSKHENNMCPICLSEYSPNDTLKMLPYCLHRFHADCIDIWLKTKSICPICRSSLTRNPSDLVF